MVLGFIFYVNNRTPSSDEIRVRILANSNSDADQQAKRNLKNILLPILQTQCDGETPRLNALKIQEDLLKKINDPMLSKNISVEFRQCSFPAKSYQDKFLPAGRYNTLLVTIGSGEGKNWWTVLYPEFFGIAFEDDDQEVSYHSWFYDKFIKK
jgi:stage II sporulation protein R